jgi:hypothetical protein
MSFNLFHHTISFHKADPLGDGLREEIEAEQLEPEAITLQEGLDEGQIEQYLDRIVQDVKEDPEWFHSIDE